MFEYIPSTHRYLHVMHVSNSLSASQRTTRGDRASPSLPDPTPFDSFNSKQRMHRPESLPLGCKSRLALLNGSSMEWTTHSSANGPERRTRPRRFSSAESVSGIFPSEEWDRIGLCSVKCGVCSWGLLAISGYCQSLHLGVGGRD